MIIPSHYQITVDIIVIHQIPVLKRVQIARFTHCYIVTWHNHSEHIASGIASGRTAVGVDSIFMNQTRA
jgi:hypothetical protein